MVWLPAYVQGVYSNEATQAFTGIASGVKYPASFGSVSVATELNHDKILPFPSVIWKVTGTVSPPTFGVFGTDSTKFALRIT